MNPIHLTNAQIFDGTGSELFPGEVLIYENRILKVANGNDQISTAGAKVIDCQGQTLMPGLVESHAHLSWISSVGRIYNQMMMPPEEHLLITAHNARVLLDHGFTSAYSAGSLGTRFEIALKKEIEGGWTAGPRLIPSSLEQGPKNVPGVPEAEGNTHGRSVRGLRKYVKSMAEMGIESIKLLLSDDDAFTPGGSQTLMFSDEEVSAVSSAARHQGVWLACHAQASEAVKQAVRNGFRIVYHCSHADEEALDMLEAKKDEIFVAPAVGLRYARMYEAEDFGVTREVAEKMGVFAEVERMQKLYPEMRRRGIRVLPGGDYGFPYNPIGRNARDLQLFIELFGYSAPEVLRAATKFGGELMNQKVGLIREGYLADLLLVKGNPLKDVRILQDKENLLLIMKNGQFHKENSINGGN